MPPTARRTPLVAAAVGLGVVIVTVGLVPRDLVYWSGAGPSGPTGGAEETGFGLGAYLALLGGGAVVGACLVARRRDREARTRAS